MRGGGPRSYSSFLPEYFWGEGDPPAYFAEISVAALCLLINVHIRDILRGLSRAGVWSMALHCYTAIREATLSSEIFEKNLVMSELRPGALERLSKNSRNFQPRSFLIFFYMRKIFGIL